MKFQLSYDTYVAKKIETGAWHANVIVLLQDHMPKTARAAKLVGIRLWSDQINYSYEASDRISSHWEALGVPYTRRNESDNYEMLAMADFVTAPSTYAKNTILTLAVKAKHLAIIPYGVDGSLFFRNQYELKDYSTIFARANTVAKGGDIFLIALSEMGEEFINILEISKLNIIILGNLDFVIQRLLNELNFDPRIKFTHGSVPSLDVPKLLRASSLFVMPSLSDSMSLACIEAMQSGLPLIITPFVGIDCFKNGKMGIQIEATKDDIASALIFAAKSKDQWAIWGDHAAASAKLLSWEAYEVAISRVAAVV